MRCTVCKLKGSCLKLRSKSSNHFKWTFHNLIAHPLSEILHIFGMTRIGNSLHDWSIPDHLPEEGRG